MKTDQLIRALVQDVTTPPVNAGTALRRSLPLAFGIMATGWLALVGIRADLMSTGLRAAVMKVALGVLLAAFGYAAAIRLSHPEQSMHGSLRTVVIVPILAGMAIVAELATIGSANWPARLTGHSVPVCLLVIPALAALPMAGAFWGLRRGATVHPATVGGFAGMGSAGLAIVAYGLFCDEDSALFIATWYLLASGVAALIGAAAGRIALRW